MTLRCAAIVRSIVTCVLLLALPTLGLASPGAGPPRALRVLVSADEEPEVFALTPGVPPGFERELVDGFARVHQREVVVVRVPRFEEIIPALLRHEGDVIMAIVDTERRRKQVDFTLPNLPSRHIVVTRRPHPGVRSVEALRRERVGVVRGTSWEEAARAAGVPDSQLKGFADVPALLSALRSGDVSAAVMSVSNGVLTARRDPALQTGLTLPGTSGGVAWGVRKEDDELRAALDEYLGNLRKTPTWSRLVVKYFGDDALNVLGRDRAP